MSVRVDYLVIGAGVVGAAVAELLSRKKPNSSIVIIESGPRPGEGITSRNSGVIHAGIYYSPQSLKAKLCVRGNQLIYEWVEKYDVPHRRVGKLIIAKGRSQIEVLEQTFQNAKASGARDLQILSKNEVKQREPALEVDAAVFSPWTGIVDPYSLTRSLLNVAEERGAITVLNQKVLGLERLDDGAYSVQTQDDKFEACSVINSAGLFSDEIARLVGVDLYQIYPCRGDYFSVRSTTSFSHLIYPVKDPHAAGLGVHLTIDLAGNYKLGPDVEYVNSKTDFTHADHKQAVFEEAAKNLFGPISFSAIRYDSCGIRPKLRSPEEKIEKDFVISEDLPGFVNLIGIESPGLTSSLAIAERVLEYF